MPNRARLLNRWSQNGGILITGFGMFRDLVGLNRVKTQSHKKAVTRCLSSPGPDLAVVDEGHLIKNHNTRLFKTLCQLETQRRLVITGSPLQNNLLEYHTMVDFARKGMLGTRKE